MKELAEQAATDSYSDTQRAIMNSEFQQVALEMTRIASSTGFNNIYLLNSTLSFNFHVGSATTIDFAAELMTATGLGLGSTGSAESTANQVGTPNPNLTGWITGGDGAASDGKFDIKFGTETAIGPITFTDGTTYSMNQVAQMINAASQTAGSYNAASISYDSGTNLYSLKISAKNNGDVAVVYNAGGNAQIGLVSTDFTGTDGDAGALLPVAIDTKSGAISALPSLSTAIDTKDSYRAKMGYMMNRLESAVSIVNIQAENLLAAQSRISDVDTATESAAMTRNQVLAQAGIAILAQANTMPQMALQLLK
jgi:flagellin